jgi:hypothetical protein
MDIEEVVRARAAEVPADALVRKTERGSSVSWEITRGVLAVRVEGHLDSDLWIHLFEDTDVLVLRQDEGAVLYANWWGVTGYDRNVHLEAIKSAVKRRGILKEMNFLLSSPLVRAGVKAASLVLSNVKAFGDPEAFFKAQDLAVEQASRVSVIA